MTTALLGDHEVHIDDEGFMTDPAEWSEDLADVLAKQIDIALTSPCLWSPRASYAGLVKASHSKARPGLMSSLRPGTNGVYKASVHAAEIQRYEATLPSSA